MLRHSFGYMAENLLHNDHRCAGIDEPRCEGVPRLVADVSGQLDVFQPFLEAVLEGGDGYCVAEV